MKNKLFILLIGFITLFGLVALSVPAVTESDTYTGYLVDTLCWDAGTGADDSNVKTNPEDHTVMCALMKPCIQSGYSLLVKNSSGVYEAHTLDKKGNRMAVKYLKNLHKTKDVRVDIKGTWDGDVLKVESIMDVM